MNDGRRLDGPRLDGPRLDRHRLDGRRLGRRGRVDDEALHFAKKPAALAV